MSEGLIGSIHPARLAPYYGVLETSGFAVENTESIQSTIRSMYCWQVSLSAAWYESLSLFEVIVRNSVDSSLRIWNTGRNGESDWLLHPAAPLRKIVGKAGQTTRTAAELASRLRQSSDSAAGNGVVPSLDDRVAQLTFGNLVHLFPQTVPKRPRQSLSGFTARENIWIHGLKSGFPNFTNELIDRWHDHSVGSRQRLPEILEQGYAISWALNNLRVLRNRISHQEQILFVDHESRLAEMRLILDNISPSARREFDAFCNIDRLTLLKPY